MLQQLLQITESRDVGLTSRLNQSCCIALDKLLRCDRSVLQFPGCKYGVQLHAPMKCYRTLSNSAPDPQVTTPVLTYSALVALYILFVILACVMLSFPLFFPLFC